MSSPKRSHHFSQIDRFVANCTGCGKRTNQYCEELRLWMCEACQPQGREQWVSLVDEKKAKDEEKELRAIAVMAMAGWSKVARDEKDRQGTHPNPCIVGALQVDKIAPGERGADERSDALPLSTGSITPRPVQEERRNQQQPERRSFFQRCCGMGGPP